MMMNSELLKAHQNLHSLPEGSQERRNAVKGIFDRALALDGYSRSERRRIMGQLKAELSEQAEQEADELRASIRSYLSH